MRCRVSLVFAQFQAWCVWYLKPLLSSVSLHGQSVFRDAGREAASDPGNQTPPSGPCRQYCSVNIC